VSAPAVTCFLVCPTDSLRGMWRHPPGAQSRAPRRPPPAGLAPASAASQNPCPRCQASPAPPTFCCASLCPPAATALGASATATAAAPAAVLDVDPFPVSACSEASTAPEAGMSAAGREWTAGMRSR